MGHIDSFITCRRQSAIFLSVFYRKTNVTIISIQYSFYDFHTGIRRTIIHYNALYPSIVCLINNRLDTFLNIFFNIVDRNDYRQLYFHIHLFRFSFLYRTLRTINRININLLVFNEQCRYNHIISKRTINISQKDRQHVSPMQ